MRRASEGPNGVSTLAAMGATDHAGTSARPDAGSPVPEERPGAVNWGPPRGRSAVLRAARRALVLGHSSTATRRVVPAPVAFRLIDGFAMVSERKRTGLWQQNERFYADLVRHTPLAGSEGEISGRAMREFMACTEIFWRPWLMCRGEVENRHLLTDAQREGRGVVAVFPHFGPVYAQFPTMARHGLDGYVVASPHHYDEDSGNSYDARWARQGRDYLDMLGAGHVLLRATGAGSLGAFGQVMELLDAGKTALIAFDIVGSMPTPFLGRTLGLSSGAARLAKESDALVVPYVHRRDGSLPVLRFAEAIDPRGFDDAPALQRAIAHRMERWALEAPESVWPLHTQPGGSPLIRGPELDATPSSAPAAR